MKFLTSLKRCLAGICLFLGMSHIASAQVGAGTYTGTYSGNDHGSITITIDQYGAVTCKLTSAVDGSTFSGSGGVASQSPFVISCTSSSGFPYLNVSANGTAGGTLTGQYGAQATTTSQYLSGNLTVTASGGATGSINYGAISGLWYDPAYSGSGFNFLGSGAGLAVTFYGWDANGNYLWLTGLGPTTMQIGTTVTISMTVPTGGTFVKPVVNPKVTWGTLQLTFNSCTSGTAVLNGKDGTITQNIQILAGVKGVPGC